MVLIDESIVYKNWEDSDNSETIKRKSSVSKSGLNYTVANGSFVNVGAEDNGDNTIASANVGFPRSETIAAIGHRPYTGDLMPVRVSKEKSIKRNEENDDKEDFCKKCGHYSKRQ